MKSLIIVRTFLRSFQRRRESNLTKNGCPTEDLGHDGLRIESVNTIMRPLMDRFGKWTEYSVNMFGG